MTQNSPLSRRSVPLWMIGTIIALLVALAIFVYYQFIVLDGPIPEHAGELYAGLESGYTAQGFPRLGSPDALVIVENFSSYACPHCREFHEDRFPDLVDEIASGQVQFVYIAVPHVGPEAKNAAQALLCAGEQDRLWTMHDVLYDWQSQYLTRTFAKKRLLNGAENLGLDVAAFEACLTSDHTTAVIDAARSEFTRRGLTGTPSFFINGVKVQDYREFDDLGALADELKAG